jgi:hypothetical protein
MASSIRIRDVRKFDIRGVGETESVAGDRTPRRVMLGHGSADSNKYHIFFQYILLASRAAR